MELDVSNKYDKFRILAQAPLAPNAAWAQSTQVAYAWSKRLQNISHGPALAHRILKKKSNLSMESTVLWWRPGCAESTFSMSFAASRDK